MAPEALVLSHFGLLEGSPPLACWLMNWIGKRLQKIGLKCSDGCTKRRGNRPRAPNQRMAHYNWDGEPFPTLAQKACLRACHRVDWDHARVAVSSRFYAPMIRPPRTRIRISSATRAAKWRGLFQLLPARPEAPPAASPASGEQKPSNRAWFCRRRRARGLFRPSARSPRR
jgi:hypothetical protein